MHESTHDAPTTAVSSHHSSSVASTPKRKKGRRRQEKRTLFNYCNIPGIYKLIISEETQKAIGCVAGEHATVEKPWINVEKEALMENLELHVESSEFLPLKMLITEYPRTELLLGYVPDESREFDEFYVCVTEQATDLAREVIAKIQKMQEDKLNNAINKKVKEWLPLGSDAEVDEEMVRLHRPLVEVEIESKYPILPFKVEFRQIRSQDMRDGYMEMRPTDESANLVYRKRIDASVQVAPSVKPNHAQTTCTYPSNCYTQYEYNIPPNPTVPDNLNVKLVEDIDDTLDELLEVNGTIDLYKNDYESLVLNPKFTTPVKGLKIIESLCFVDMNLCGNKMISSACFHPMWTGIVALSYVDMAPSLYIQTRVKKDEVYKAVHDSNPVLVWSVDDDLKAKLILETPREVYALSFCPYDENLLMGGCFNGQIILWDLTNKLSRVEEEEILTVDQQKYRIYMHSLMSWMKNIFDLALVRPTAISDLQYSHCGCVNTIRWMSPFHAVSKTGKIEGHAERTLQVLTASEDGTIMIWDLKKKPQVIPGGFKAMRKLRRLKKRPSALMVDESPYKILHLNLKPIYRINIKNTFDNFLPLHISSFFVRFFAAQYELDLTKPTMHENIVKTARLTDRIFYKPVLSRERTFTRQHFFIGTMEGHFIQGTWDGQEFDSGEIVNFEDCQFVSYGRYHDGPVVSIDYNWFNDTILTVGGRIFALWREDFPNYPFLWRKGHSIYSNGSWFISDHSSIKMVRIDGFVEMWQLYYRSQAPVTISLMSNGAVSLVETHPRIVKQILYGLCDYRGAFRLFRFYRDSPAAVAQKKLHMGEFVNGEIQRKREFFQWQDNWNKRYAEMLQELLDKMRAAEDTEAPKFETTEKAEKKPKEAKMKFQKISPGDRYMEYVAREQAQCEQERIKEIILEKKQLNTEELLRLREPLRRLEEENELKKRKQKTKLKESDKIFRDIVAMLFPDIVREKPIPPPDPYETTFEDGNLNSGYQRFKQLQEEAVDYVERNPFTYDFNWLSVLKAGRARRTRLDDNCDRMIHRKRYADVKAAKASKMPSLQNLTSKSVITDDESVDLVSQTETLDE